jgi:hypothetical protein
MTNTMNDYRYEINKVIKDVPTEEGTFNVEPSLRQHQYMTFAQVCAFYGKTESRKDWVVSELTPVEGEDGVVEPTNTKTLADWGAYLDLD